MTYFFASSDNSATVGRACMLWVSSPIFFPQAASSVNLWYCKPCGSVGRWWLWLLHCIIWKQLWRVCTFRRRHGDSTTQQGPYSPCSHPVVSPISRRDLQNIRNWYKSFEVHKKQEKLLIFWTEFIVTQLNLLYVPFLLPSCYPKNLQVLCASLVNTKNRVLLFTKSYYKLECFSVLAHKSINFCQGC